MSQSVGQSLGERLSRLDIAVIDPGGARAVVVAELVLKPARVTPRIAPAIADEDLRAGQATFDPGSQSDRCNLPSRSSRGYGRVGGERIHSLVEIIVLDLEQR